MNGIELLIKEHENILLFTDYLKTLCCDVIDGKEPDIKSFCECIEFGRNYADKHHHGKEEKILFRYMLDKLGPVADKLVRNGMLVEHDLGRYHIGELEKALISYEDNKITGNKLEIITHAAGYANLLKRHIQKEDEVCYTYAERMLSQEDKDTIDKETKQLEKQQEEKGVQNHYLSWLKSKI